MTDHYRISAGQPDGAASGNVPPDQIVDDLLREVGREVTAAFHVQALDDRIAARGRRPIRPYFEHRSVITLQVVCAILAAGFLAAGIGDRSPGMIASSSVVILIMVCAATVNLSQAKTYRSTLFASAYDSLQQVENALRQERARCAEAEAECDLALDLKTPLGGEGFIYVLGFATGVVKVGQTIDPARRIREHRRDAATFGVNLVSFWVSPAHQNFMNNEATLIAACLAVSARSRKEYFHEIGFAEAIRIAGGLTFYSNDLSGRSCRGGRND